ncbi:VWA domain-containing protein [Gordonia jacobaea]|uniref:VWA domain-containing protein n=1 Tax=Gordonia jacobaea TaxID=122202 RepID=UPI003D751107
MSGRHAVAAPVSATPARYPFSAVVGQERLKLALILCAVSPGIGGVLIRGEKGTAKSTIVRGLGPLIAHEDTANGGGDEPSAGRVVELPIGATEDRVVGSLDLTAVLRDGEAVFTPGLLARADGGVLYIDEVNLLADHLVDVLLDAAASGRVTIERDGVSHTQAADFVLVGTMNPEEGELRPQLLDRFGLAVDVTAAREVDDRVEVIRRRMDFDADPDRFVERYADDERALSDRIAAARATVGSVEISARELRRIAGICSHLDVDGLRGDIVVARTAAAHAALRGATSVTEEDVRVGVELALPHRRRRDPFDESGMSEQQLDDALSAGDDAAGPPEEPEPDPDGPDGAPAPEQRDESSADFNPADSDPTGPQQDSSDEPVEQDVSGQSQQPPRGQMFGAAASSSGVRMRRLRADGVGDGDPGKRSRARSRRGHTVSDTDFAPGGPVHLFGTVLRAAGRSVATTEISTTSERLSVAPVDLRGAQRIGQEGNLVVFVVDLSGSMTARRRLSAVSRLCVDLLRDSYTRRDRVAVIVARGSRAELAVPPTKSVDIAVRRLADIRTGGRTPLAEGLIEAQRVIERARRADPRRRPLLVVLTDGRATAGPDAAGRASVAAQRIRRNGIDSVVVDCEQGAVRLGLAADLAVRLGAQTMRMDELSVAALSAPAADRRQSRTSAA